jgi:hypothetical protein
MLTSFQYRLQQYESAPPAESWQNIMLRLKEECQHEEIIISTKLSGFIQDPPADIWSAISAGLSQPDTTTDFVELPAQFGWPSSEPSFDAKSVSALEASTNESGFKEQATKEPATKEFSTRHFAKQELATEDLLKRELVPSEPTIKALIDSEQESPTTRARVIPFNWPRVAIAAAVLGIAISALYYFVSRDNTIRQLTAKTNPGKGKSGELERPVIVPDRDRPIASAPGINMAITGGGRLFRKRDKPTLPAPAEQASNDAEIANTDISYANINGPDRVTSVENITIPTQPIRDNQGKIIMDEKLISAPDENYVTVTSPNGEQTKISKKFLHALSYMNAGSEDENIGIALQESAMWKWLFREWRQKLLTQPSFIPSTTNFLDIMELKEILHEKF